MSVRYVSPNDAATLLGLLDSAKLHAPGCELAWVRGFCAARINEASDEARLLRCRQIEELEARGQPNGRYAHVQASPLGRVELKRRSE